MKKLLIPIVALLLIGCGEPSSSVYTIDASPPPKPAPTELKYKPGDKVLLRLGIEGVVTKIGGWDDDKYYVRMLLVNISGRVVLSEVILHEFEIEKKID